MIECELCEDYFHSDEIQECPECGIEICERCFEKHVRFCVIGIEDEEEEDYDDEISSLPRECPKCGEDLQLDINYDETILLCNKCNYQLDVTEKFSKFNLDDGIEE